MLSNAAILSGFDCVTHFKVLNISPVSYEPEKIFRDSELIALLGINSAVQFIKIFLHFTLKSSIENLQSFHTFAPSKKLLTG